MQSEFTPRFPEKSNIIRVNLGAPSVVPDRLIRTKAPRWADWLNLVLHLFFLAIVALSIWACAQESITLSANHALDSVVERATTRDVVVTAGRKSIMPERS
jgi:hypothetical protein